jgi:Coenzyme PQQ synthesis protein D (PqqD)
METHPMDTSIILARAAGFAISEFDGEHMIFDPVEGRAIYLNDTASLVWQLCDGHRSVGDITVLLQDAYPDSAEVHTEVEVALKVFLEQRVVEIK